MKGNKSLLCIVATVLVMGLFSLESRAQSSWELGIRFGDDFAVDATIPLSARPRLHAAAYFGHDFGLGGYFDWLFSLDGGPTGLKFFPGVGPEFYFGNDFNFAVAGDFGVEYGFDFPLTIGLDWRPRFMVTDGFSPYWGNWGLTARFRFGEGVGFKPAK